jgi:hypothetical protein
MFAFFLFLESLLISTLLFLYLNYKAKVELKYLFIDNLIVAIAATIITYLFKPFVPKQSVFCTCVKYCDGSNSAGIKCFSKILQGT